MLSALINRPATLVIRVDSGEVDDYGNAVLSETTVETVAELQQRRRDEPEGQGETSETDWVLFLPAGTALTTADTVTVEPLGTFEVVGDPWPARNPRTRVESHVECSVRKAGT